MAIKETILASFKEDPHKARAMIKLFGESEAVVHKDESSVIFHDRTIWMEPVEGFAKKIYYQVKMVPVNMR